MPDLAFVSVLLLLIFVLLVSNSVVVYLRLLTSAQIRADPDAFAPFLFHPELGIQMEPREFCENFVESVGKEAG